MYRLLNIMGLLLACLCYGQTVCAADLFGVIDAVNGKASMSDKAGQSINAALGAQVFEGYTITTDSDSELHIITVDGGVIALRPGTTFRIDEYKAFGGAKDKMSMTLSIGSIRSVTGWIGKRSKAAYSLSTPTAVIHVLGTDHEVAVVEKATGISDEAGTYNMVTEGTTLIETLQGETDVRQGRVAFAPKERAVPPYALPYPPKFFTDRSLKLESRIPLRKSYLHEHLEEIREARIKRVLQEGLAAPGDDEELADPTRPTTPWQSEEKPRLELQQVFMSPRRNSAVINGQEVKLGGKLGEATLSNIRDNEVTITHPDGATEVVRMHPSIDKHLTSPSSKTAPATE